MIFSTFLYNFAYESILNWQETIYLNVNALEFFRIPRTGYASRLHKQKLVYMYISVPRTHCNIVAKVCEIEKRRFMNHRARSIT